MRLVARQPVQPAEREVPPGLMPSVAYDGIRLQIPRPTRLESPRRRFETQAGIDESSLDVSRDLAAARGSIGAIAIGAALWGAILLTLRVLTS